MVRRDVAPREPVVLEVRDRIDGHGGRQHQHAGAGGDLLRDVEDVFGDVGTHDRRHVKVVGQVGRGAEGVCRRIALENEQWTHRSAVDAGNAAARHARVDLLRREQRRLLSRDVRPRERSRRVEDRTDQDRVVVRVVAVEGAAVRREQGRALSDGLNANGRYDAPVERAGEDRGIAARVADARIQLCGRGAGGALGVRAALGRRRVVAGVDEGVRTARVGAVPRVAVLACTSVR